MSGPIRVLCVFSTLDRGGSESMCMNLYRHIDRDKVQFDFVKHTSEKGAFEDEIRALGGQIYEAPRYKVCNHMQYKRWWHRHLEHHPEHQIVHGHFFSIASIYLRAAKRHGCVTIAHVHMAPPKKHGISVARRAKLRLVERTELYSDVCLACSEESGQWLFPNKGYIVLKNGIDVDAFVFNQSIRNRMRKQLGIEDDCKLVAVVGNLSAVKNPYGILSICECLQQAMKKPWKLIWCGSGKMHDELEETAKAMGLNDHVFFLGVRDDVNRLLQAADVYLMPSFSEGLPVAAIEAQAAGLPCYISDVVTREVDITGLCEFLPLGEWGNWADAILNRLLERKNTSALITQAGYNVSDTARWIQELYLDLQR